MSIFVDKPVNLVILSIIMKGIELAKTYNLDPSVISHIKHGNRFTDNIDLAFAMAELTGKKPIEFIHRKLKKFALAAHPELNKKKLSK